jgi:hypothetical protein
VVTLKKTQFTASVALILHIMTYLDQNLNSFILQVASKTTQPHNANPKKLRQGGSLTQLLDDGAVIFQLCEQADRLLGPITITLYFIHLILSACGIFFGTSLAEGLMKKNYLLITYGTSNFLLSICSMQYLWSLMNKGQRLCDSFARVKKSLQDLFIAKANILTAKERAQMDVLTERYSKDSPMRPMGVFSLNRASGTSISGLILTYIIVLLQFKSGEG